MLTNEPLLLTATLQSWAEELNLNCKSLISFHARTKQTNARCRTFVQRINISSHYIRRNAQK